jgi:Pre-mRNA-splicing factor of RES complex/Ankyrin repeats (many copies)
MAKLLLYKEGIDLDSKDSYYGQIPLWRAAYNGHEAVVKLLLNKEGVDLNSKDDRVEFFLPAKNVGFNGIASDIKRYLEPGAFVSVRVHHKDGRAGYLVKAHRAVTTAMIANLKTGSTRWREEQATISRPRSANFHTIQTLYGVEDRRHLAQFKIERFLDKLDNNYHKGQPDQAKETVYRDATRRRIDVSMKQAEARAAEQERLRQERKEKEDAMGEVQKRQKEERKEKLEEVKN